MINAIDRASGALASVGNSVSSLGDRFRGLGDVVKQAAGFITGLLVYDALSELRRGIQESIDLFMEFESTLADIQIASGLSAEAFAPLRDNIIQIAQSLSIYGVNMAEATAATEALVKAGLSGSDAVAALTGAIQLAKLEGIDYARASELLVQIMNQFSLSASEATRVVDVLVNASIAAVGSAADLAQGLSYAGTIASQLGFSLEETTAALVALNNAGLEAGRAGRNLQAMLSDLIEHSDRLGFSIYDTSGKLLSLPEIINRLVDHLQSLGSEEERNAYLMEVFGQQGMRAAAILLNLAGEGENAGDVLRELAVEIGRTGTASEAMSLKMNTTSGRLARLNAEFDNFKIMLGDFLASILLPVIDAFRWLGGVLSETVAPIVKNLIMPAVRELNSVWSKLNESLEESGIDFNILTEIIKILATGVMVTLWAIIKAVTLVIQGATSAVETLTGAVRWLSDRLNELINIFTNVKSTVLDIWGSLWNSIFNIVVNILNSVIDKIKSVFGSIVDFFNQLWNALTGGSIWVDLWEDIEKITVDYSRSTESSVEEFTKRLRERFDKFRNELIQPIQPKIDVRQPNILDRVPGRNVVNNITVNVSGAYGDPEELADVVSRRIVERLQLVM